MGDLRLSPHTNSSILAEEMTSHHTYLLNPLIATLKPHSNGPSYRPSNTVIGTVHWPFMGGLLHLVQRGGDWAGPQPAQAPPRCTKCKQLTHQRSVQQLRIIRRDTIIAFGV